MVVLPPVVPFSLLQTEIAKMLVTLAILYKSEFPTFLDQSLLPHESIRNFQVSDLYLPCHIAYSSIPGGI
jgi:hypothetical protein